MLPLVVRNATISRALGGHSKLVRRCRDCAVTCALPALSLLWQYSVAAAVSGLSIRENEIRTYPVVRYQVPTVPTDLLERGKI